MNIPPRIRRVLGRALRRFAPSLAARRSAAQAAAAVAGTPSESARPGYESLYEQHSQTTGDDGVGGGDYDVIGEVELDILRTEGLQPTSSLLDFGCGNGRLAVHAVPFLNGGRYVGTDIAPTFLAHARARLDRLAEATAACDVRLVHQDGEHFDVDDHSIDVLCAFSVFTHMEHEDMYRYLQHFARIVRPGGKVIISCLPMDLADARYIFTTEAALDPAARWQRVRNITTSMDLVDSIATLAGWTVDHWLPGSGGQAMSDAGELRGLGQSVVVLTH